MVYLSCVTLQAETTEHERDSRASRGRNKHYPWYHLDIKIKYNIIHVHVNPCLFHCETIQKDHSPKRLEMFFRWLLWHSTWLSVYFNYSRINWIIYCAFTCKWVWNALHFLKWTTTNSNFWRTFCYSFLDRHSLFRHTNLVTDIEHSIFI